ncbi:MAG: YihY/virulence factor BrkB family protein [Bacteroidales bacterium]|nr:YihY/virulence factor BrkB family protein [Bacteroidales bacterium]
MPDLAEKYNKAKEFVFRDIWKMDMSGLSIRKQRFYNAFKVLIITVKGFVEDRCGIRASALTYYTLLSVVPIIALAFAIAKGFGLENLVEDIIRNSFASSPDTANYLISFSSSMLENTKGGIIAGIGVVMLLYSVFKLLSNIEESFNHMWNVKNSRSLLRQVTDYITIMIFTPIMLIIASSVTFFLQTQASAYFSDYLGPLLFVLVKLVPYILMAVMFTILYLIMPNTKVDVSSAVIAGSVTGVIFQIWQWIFVTFQVGASEYGAIYGSFAALPLFLMWVQTSWIIVLLGCELAYSVQNVSLYTTERTAGNMSGRLQKRISLLIMSKIIGNFANQKPPCQASVWSAELKISQKLFVYIAQRLQEVGLLAEVKTDNPGNPVFIPAMDISKISVDTIWSRLESYGDDEDFPMMTTDELKRMDSLIADTESTFKQKLKSIMLKDL